jgi:hypothetical protein
MNDSTDTPKRNHVGRVLVAVLFFQLGLAGLLFWDDIADGLRMPGLSPRAPALDDPIRPGDQTRRFQPDRARPGGIPMPASPLPDRLTLTVVEAGTRVLLEGTIQAGDAERIQKQLSALEPMPEGVFLNSPGGSVRDALVLGRALRQMGMTTALRSGDICYSACPYLLAAGTSRTIPEDASVGVHQHFFGENTLLPTFLAVEDIQRGQGEVMEYLDQMGIDPLVMRHALATPSDEIYLLLPEELESYGFTKKPS